MKALRARVIKFSIDGLWGGHLDAPRTLLTLVGDSEQARDVGDGVAGLAVRSPCVQVLGSDPQRFPLRGLPAVWFCQLILTGVRNCPIWVASLNRAVNETGVVNGETGEFEGLRVANVPNHHG
jgi:hypothetical protein